MKLKNGILVFEETQEIVITEQKVRAGGINWGSLALSVRAEYIFGRLFTNKNNPVNALLLIKDSVEVRVWDKTTFRFQTNRQDLINQVKIECGYNCFGYCFAQGKYFIDDPYQIIADDYEEVMDIEKAKKIILLTTEGYDDRGLEGLKCIHAVNINPDKSISFKPGIRELIKKVPINDCRKGYNSSKEILLKPVY